jgi:predicted RNase H-like HicB family nuclease
MKLKVIIHEAEEGGYWAEVPSIKGCMTQGGDEFELINNLHEAIEACLLVDLEDYKIDKNSRIMELPI